MKKTTLNILSSFLLQSTEYYNKCVTNTKQTTYPFHECLETELEQPKFSNFLFFPISAKLF